MQQPLSDADLAAAQSGDRVALTKLIQAHRQGVYRYGLQVCRTTEDAEDALQQTLWLATRAIRNFRGAASSLVSWMFTIIRRECYRLLDRRNELLVAATALDFAEASDHRPDDALLERRRAALLADALSALDPIHREVIILRDIEEMTAPEAAARLQISVQALKSRLHRARTNLRAQVIVRGETR